MNILFLSYWGWGRGQAYITLNYVKMLQNTEHKVFILKQGTNKITEEFKTVNAKIIEYPEYDVDKDFFKKCIIDNNINTVIFNEYHQWGSDGNDLVTLTKELGAKAYGYLVMEKFLPEQVEPYDRIFAPTLTCKRLMRTHGIRKFTYIPFSIDLNEFPFPKPKETKEKFIFLHPGGWGGVYNRKNTEKVLNAFRLLYKEEKNIELIITSQKKLEIKNLPKNVTVIDKELTRKELIDLFYKADATVNPSKWETVGIPNLESLATGTPVITTDLPPMNEFIRPCLNGFLTPPTIARYDKITVVAGEINIIDLKIKMKNIMNELTHRLMCRNSRHVIEQIYDLEKNKKYLLKFLEKESGG